MFAANFNLHSTHSKQELTARRMIPNMLSDISRNVCNATQVSSVMFKETSRFQNPVKRIFLVKFARTNTIRLKKSFIK